MAAMATDEKMTVKSCGRVTQPAAALSRCLAGDGIFLANLDLDISSTHSQIAQSSGQNLIKLASLGLVQTNGFEFPL